MVKRIARSLVAYSIHGHVNPGGEGEAVVDYGALFESIERLGSESLRARVSGDVVAISRVERTDGLLAMLFVAGSEGELPLVYDPSTASAEEVDPGGGRFVVNGVWGFFDPEERYLVMEKRRPGVAIYQIERLLTGIARRAVGDKTAVLSLNPVPAPSFVREVQRFTRIREASITMRRPNHSWTDDAIELLAHVGDSNAAQVQVQLNADRGQSLSKSDGIVRDVMRVAQHPVGPLQNATVRGTFPDQEGERAVSLRRHIVTGTTRVDGDVAVEQRAQGLAGGVRRLFERLARLGVSEED